jgi:hypothetical protein
VVETLANVTVTFLGPEEHVLIQTRQRDDLPVNIRGRAKWVQYFSDERSAYTIPDQDGITVPIEFVNNESWYELYWASDIDPVGYYTSPNDRQGTFGGQLGTWDQPYGSQLPSPVAGPASPVDIVVPFFTPKREPTPEEPPAITFREPTPAVSSDTPSRSATPESTQELNTKGKAPERAPALTIAEIMAGTQTITAGMVQVQQQQQQAPAQQGGGGGPPAGGGGPAGGQPAGGPPAGGPPAGGGGPPGGGPPGGQPPAAQAAVAAAPQNGSLGGKAPTTYDGERSKTRIFIHQFKLYRMANATNFKMVNPTARVSLFLGFMDGPKVIGWAQEQAELLERRVLGYFDDNNNFVAATHPDNDEFVWNDMLQHFTRAFTHTTEADDAFIELQNCKMGERSPDEYIAEFNELSRKAHWDHDNRGTIELFKQGLPVNIHRRILGRDAIPQSMPQWQEQLRKEVERSRLIQASTGVWRSGKGNISTRENLFRGILDPRTQPKGNFGRPRPRDPDAMDVDRVQVTGLSTEERAQLYEERKCFHCKRPGHIAKDCRSRQQQGGRTPPGQNPPRGQGYQNNPPKGKAPAPRSRPQARPAKIEEVVDDRDLPEDTEAQTEEPPPYDLKRAETMIRTMKAEDRVKLLENISFLEGF